MALPRCTIVPPAHWATTVQKSGSRTVRAALFHAVARVAGEGKRGAGVGSTPSGVGPAGRPDSLDWSALPPMRLAEHDTFPRVNSRRHGWVCRPLYLPARRHSNKV